LRAQIESFDDQLGDGLLRCTSEAATGPGARARRHAVPVFATGCVVEPREGFYDRDHHRWYHEHTWHECVEHDEHCAR